MLYDFKAGIIKSWYQIPVKHVGLKPEKPDLALEMHICQWLSVSVENFLLALYLLVDETQCICVQW